MQNPVASLLFILAMLTGPCPAADYPERTERTQSAGNHDWHIDPDKGNDGNPVMGPVPSADVAAIAAIGVNADKEKAVGNNYELISMRTSTGGGMTDLQVRTTKTTTQTKNKLRNVEYSEDTLRSNIQTLYDTILEQKAAYDSAVTALQSAQITWDAAQIQRQNGSLSRIGYLQQELAYLQAQSAFDCADLALQQAMQNYDWAVKGVTVSTE